MAFLKRILIFNALLFTPLHAHMRLHYPPSFAAENNPHRTDPPDNQLEYPYNCCGKTTIYPCRGYLNLLGSDQGKPVARWSAGSAQNFTLIGTGNHYGGSCQAGFSVDKGKSWKVISSYEGNCPHRRGRSDTPSEQAFQFTVPSDMPPGDHVFAWTWINREQEFYMLCSPVTITAKAAAGLPSNSAFPSPPVPAPSSLPKDSASLAGIYPPRQINRPTRQPELEPTIASKSVRRRGRFKVKEGRRGPENEDPPANHSAFDDRPGFLIANIGNGCKTVNGKAEVKYPNPGPDIVRGDGEYPLELPWPINKCS
ncbi:hypothetical protein LOZ07_005612 [Ophidiomyces ophidiicola]|uniref:Uncharacterized protein n=1 Tax=Ophidiomyces ophidiicola TaxID=1387563 RepID=A0ACB8UQ13_9EURO|nr:hypothetical protein LOZ48_004423 [Ophidiomyces ophidiicola]KAI2045422.1 hypothetical protein LOZ38_005869 [Ophidiomyces ophidiicola]KAI2062218.1 hypothetical protein LOZ40_005971 [Ophidiomyces ophidiicola]KAI2091443.1 hypothetical protein LOZ33_005496 [Ophidiomyces ophidiicola]KAI2095664.1 hypothetical protein LOZ35_003089 [Ophidiomyces ophidiicola]